MPAPNMSLWQEGYFELKAIKHTHPHPPPPPPPKSRAHGSRGKDSPHLCRCPQETAYGALIGSSY